jgi:hypothetical protein
MSTFFCGITETIPSLFRGIFSERNSVPNPSPDTILDNLGKIEGKEANLLMTYALNFLVIVECEFFYNRTQFHDIERVTG